MTLMNEYIILDKLGEPIKVFAKNSLKAKNISIKINNQKAELIIPKGKQKKALEFLRHKEKWVRQKLSIIPTTINIPTNYVQILGRKYYIEYKKSIRQWVTITHESLIIESPLGNYDNLLMNFLQNKLLEEINQIFLELRQISGLLPQKIKIMNNKNRWGSCSSHKILSFHWRLIFTPAEILRYVVIHELCHIKEMNHSKNFWDLVETLDPNYQQHKKWLKVNSAIIHAYLPNVAFKKAT